MRPARALIDLQALRHNYQIAREVTGARALAVIKADAYGHGAVRCAQALEAEADGFAVACIEEALELRAAGIRAPVLLLEGFFEADELSLIVEHDFWCVVHSLWQLEAIEKAALSKPITVWQYATWSRTWDWDGAATIAPAPSAEPRFKWIAVGAGAIRHPGWTAEQHAESIRRDIDQALDRGYRVVVADVWNWSVDELAGHLGGVAAGSRAPVIYKMLHDNFEARQVFSDPAAGTYYELRRR